MEELKPCPFCGKKPKILITDNEGNIHDSEYEKTLGLGVGFVIDHDEVSNPNCPIANFEGETLGVIIYDSREELVDVWNTRV